MNHDELDDLALPQRPQRPEPRHEVRAEAREDMAGEMEDDREFTLSTGTVLALFFGLALICAVFFGFGYSMGHKSASAAVESAAAGSADTAGASSTADAAGKPSAGSPAVAIPSYQGAGAAADTPTRPAPTVPAPAKSVEPVRTSEAGTAVTVPLEPAVAPATAPVKKPAVDPDRMVVGEARPVSPAPKQGGRTAADAKVVTAAPEPAAAAGVGSVYVQVAAVSHKEDADTLLGALRRRGYSVFARNTDTDKLIHVQVGPFPTKKDAEAMRQRLIGDGYTPILK